MAVISVTTYEYKPGALPELVQRFATSRPILERLGAKVRFWQVTVAGVNVRRANVALRFDDYPAYAAFQKKAGADPEWQQRAQVIAKSEISTTVSNAVARELPGLEATPVTGPGGPRVRIARAYQVEKGRSQEASALLVEAKQHIERLGGRYSAVRVAFGGPASGEVVTLNEFADIEAWSVFQEKAAADAALQSFGQTRLIAAGSPLTLVSASGAAEVAP
jgi:hypothetical protein